MGSIAKQFMLSAGTGTKRELDPTLAGTASTATAVTYALNGSGSRRFSPETSNSTVQAVPGAPATFSGVGWEMDAVVSAEPIQFGDAAWVASLELAITGHTTGPNVTYTMIFFVAGAEVGRHSVAKTLFAGGIDATFGMTAAELNEALISAASPRVQIEVYANVTLAAVSLGVTTHTLRTNDADAYVDPNDYQQRVSRTISAVGVVAPVVDRKLTLKRTFAPVAIGAMTLIKQVRKTIFPAAIGAASVSKKIQKTLSFAGIGAASIPKKVLIPRTYTAIGAATVDRRLTLFRTINPASVVAASFNRAVIASRIISGVGIGAASLSKKVGKPITAAGIGAVSLSKKLFKPLTAIGIGAVTMAKRITKAITASAIGAASLNRALTIRRSITASTHVLGRMFAKIPIERIPGGGGVIQIVKKIFSVFDD